MLPFIETLPPHEVLGKHAPRVNDTADTLCQDLFDIVSIMLIWVLLVMNSVRWRLCVWLNGSLPFRAGSRKEMFTILWILQ